MQNLTNIHIRAMNIDDYDDVATLWSHIEGFYIRSVDDSRAGIKRFLERNPNLSVVAELVESSIQYAESSKNFAMESKLKSSGQVCEDGKCYEPKSHKQGKQSAEVIEMRNRGFQDLGEGAHLNVRNRSPKRRIHDLSLNDNAQQNDKQAQKIVGSILCGHDGRYGSIYHACVHRDFRLRGIGKAMVAYALEGFRRENITSIALIAFSENLVGNAFWKTQGWDLRANANRYELSLNTQNTITKNTKI